MISTKKKVRFKKKRNHARNDKEKKGENKISTTLSTKDQRMFYDLTFFFYKFQPQGADTGFLSGDFKL